jgi:hypothetical protein
MKISTHIWAIFPEDAEKLWKLFKEAGYVTHYKNYIWYITPQSLGAECSEYSPDLLESGPFAGACYFRVCLFDAQKIYDFAGKCLLNIKKIKNLGTKVEVYFLYNPKNKEKYENIFALNKKYINLD